MAGVLIEPAGTPRRGEKRKKFNVSWSPCRTRGAKERESESNMRRERIFSIGEKKLILIKPHFKIKGSPEEQLVE